MRTIVIHAPGSYDKPRLEERPGPSPARGEVFVDVRAAGGG